MTIETTALTGVEMEYVPLWAPPTTGASRRLSLAAIPTIEEALRVEDILNEVLETVAQMRSREDVPEVVDLQPLQVRKVTLDVRSARRADFSFIDDEIENAEL